MIGSRALARPSVQAAAARREARVRSAVGTFDLVELKITAGWKSLDNVILCKMDFNVCAAKRVKDPPYRDAAR